MREICTSGSEGGGAFNPLLLPLSGIRNTPEYEGEGRAPARTKVESGPKQKTLHAVVAHPNLCIRSPAAEAADRLPR